MVVSQLGRLTELQQKLVVSSTSLYLQNRICHAVFLSVIKEVSLESGMVLNEGELTAFFIKHSTNPDVLDKHLSLSLTCPAKLKELIFNELSNLKISLPPRGYLLDSEFIVGVASKGSPFIKMDVTLSDGKGGIENKNFNMSLHTFNRLEQSSNEIKNLCSH